jgi:hypothetical protein
MKKIVVLFLVLLSFNSFSQSYLILDDGVTLSFDVNGYVYDLGHYTPLNRLTAKGGQFLVEDTNVLVTVDENGLLRRKYEILPKQFISKGMNYFINEKDELFTIDQMGIVHLYEEQEKLKGMNKFGGNYIFTENDEFHFINRNGEMITQPLEGIKTDDILILGGQYFMTVRGGVFTVSRDGKIVDHQQERIGVIAKKGGNFFIDSFGILYTVAQDGSLKIPMLPQGLNTTSIIKLGSNYLIDQEGRLFTVDLEGQVWERWTDYDLRSVRVTSLK